MSLIIAVICGILAVAIVPMPYCIGVAFVAGWVCSQLIDKEIS